ncbi:MAG: 3,4-dihydroxy-2-butanone-4-phosphate synthase [Verrucomicrobiota bacterium]
MKNPSNNTLADVIEAIAAGQMVIVVDDESRENEGDLVCAAETITAEQVNFMASHGKGLICVALEDDRLEQLALHKMVEDCSNHSPYGTAFMVSVDASDGITTGISANDRAVTIARLADRELGAEGFVKPGHVFPLQANARGVLGRPGHTEAAVDLTKAAGLFPAGVICEILNADGGMARMSDLEPYAEQHHLPICRVADLVAFRRQNETVPPT